MASCVRKEIFIKFYSTTFYMDVAMQFAQILDIIETHGCGGFPAGPNMGGYRMDKKNLYMGLGMGVAACGLGAMLFRPRKNRKMKSSVGKALRTMSEVADSVSDAMGW